MVVTLLFSSQPVVCFISVIAAVSQTDFIENSCGLIAGHVGPDLNDCGNENKMQLTWTCTKPSGEHIFIFFIFFTEH